MPVTRPHTEFDDDGVCSGCRSYEARKDIDWDAREQELFKILDRYRSKDGYYDCVIPVSGGKDSHCQIIKLLDLGMKPLAVNGVTDDLSDIGRYNLDNIRELGVDSMEVAVNPIVRRKINKIALTRLGDISWPEHIAIFTFPIWISVRMNIPLVIWGENGQNEFGGPASQAKSNTLGADWIHEFGSLLGMRPSDLIGQEGITAEDLILYQYPPKDELNRVGVTGLYLGYYYSWNFFDNFEKAKKYGFKPYSDRVENQLVSFENLDNCQMGIHDYFAFLKYGLGRATSQACMMIRRDLITREEAIEKRKEIDGKFPWTYLGKDLKDILEPIGMTVDEFIQVCDQFTNKKIFKTNNQGELIKDPDGNLVLLNYDNED